MPGTARTSALRLLKRESWRLTTFREDWPHRITLGLAKEDMARAGFFFSGVRDKVQCAFCQISIQNWSSLDSAMGNHVRYTVIGHRSFCPFVEGYEVGNIPIDPVSGFDAADDEDATHINNVNLRLSPGWPGGNLYPLHFSLRRKKKKLAFFFRTGSD